MSQIVAGNARILSQLNNARDLLNAGCSFRLFSNPVTLNPGTLLSHFVECAFPGYSRLTTAGKFPTPIKLIDGLYQSTSAPFTLTVTADSPEFVYGWSISLGDDLFYAAFFPAPLPATNGRVFDVIVGLQEQALYFGAP